MAAPEMKMNFETVNDDCVRIFIAPDLLENLKTRLHKATNQNMSTYAGVDADPLAHLIKHISSVNQNEPLVVSKEQLNQLFRVIGAQASAFTPPAQAKEDSLCNEIRRIHNTVFNLGEGP